MLETSILHIKNSKRYSCSDSWKHRVSGNVIELSVNSVEITDKRKYRCSVITIGQVIKAIADRIEADGSQYHIQSFPSLENPKIIASVRIGSNGFSPKHPYFLNASEKENISHSDLLQILCSKYQFQVYSLPSSKIPASIATDGAKQWFVLSSVFDNPFIWLNLGYLKEIFIRFLSHEKPIQRILFDDLCHLEEDLQSDLHLPDNLKLQAIAGF